jgi:hypothetical protein
MKKMFLSTLIVGALWTSAAFAYESSQDCEGLIKIEVPSIQFGMIVKTKFHLEDYVPGYGQLTIKASMNMVGKLSATTSEFTRKQDTAWDPKTGEWLFSVPFQYEIPSPGGTHNFIDTGNFNGSLGILSGLEPGIPGDVVTDVLSFHGQFINSQGVIGTLTGLIPCSEKSFNN